MKGKHRLGVEEPTQIESKASLERWCGPETVRHTDRQKQTLDHHAWPFEAKAAKVSQEAIRQLLPAVHGWLSKGPATRGWTPLRPGASNVTATCKLTPLPGNAKKEREDKREQKKAAEREKQAEAWSGEYTKIESKASERYSHDAACSAGGEKSG